MFVSSICKKKFSSLFANNSWLFISTLSCGENSLRFVNSRMHLTQLPYPGFMGSHPWVPSWVSGVCVPQLTLLSLWSPQIVCTNILGQNWLKIPLTPSSDWPHAPPGMDPDSALFILGSLHLALPAIRRYRSRVCSKLLMINWSAGSHCEHPIFLLWNSSSASFLNGLGSVFHYR